MERIVRALDWSAVPLGHVLNAHVEPSPEERGAFRDWICPLNAPPNWRRMSFWRLTTEDDGRKVLEHGNKDDQALVTGENDWRDASIEADVCPLVATSAPHADDEYSFVGRSGVLVRMETSRHYVFFGIEGHTRWVLYRRENSRYTELASETIRVNLSRYYRLRLEAVGNRFRAFFDGSLVADVFDAALKRGYVGIRTNTLARFENIRAVVEPRAAAWVQRSRLAEDVLLAELRERYPKPVLVHELDIGKHGGGGLVAYGRFGSGRPNDLLFQQMRDGKPTLLSLTLDGEVLWRRSLESEFTHLKTCDLDGNGTEHLIGFSGGDLVVLSGRDGTEQARRPFPQTGIFQGLTPAPAALDAVYIAHLRRTPYPCDIVVKESDAGGGHTIWCYDEGLHLRWETTVDQPRHGHHIAFYDVDDDGREEVCAGYHLLGPDGEIRWRVEGSRSFDVFAFGRHADSCAAGDFDGDGQAEVAIVGGGEGFLLVEANSGGILAKHDVGHAQGLAVASFRRDLAGMEIHVGTRWGNYGIRAFYSALGEHLFTFQPDFVGQQGEPVNWRGDGEELVFIRSSARAYGLWNAWGQRVVLMEGVPLPVFIADLLGDPRDEFLCQRGHVIQIYSQDQPPPQPTRIYAPIRHKRFGYPIVSYPYWSEGSLP